MPGLKSQRPKPILALAALLVVLASAPAGPADPPLLTFFVASDSHFGARGMEELNRSSSGR